MLQFKAVCLQAAFLGLVLYSSIVVITATGKIFRSSCRRDVLMNATARDKKLTGTLQNIIANIHVARSSLCVKKCIEASKCMTINYKKYSQQQEKNCELLDISRGNNSVALTPDVGWIYFEPVSQVSARCQQVVCNSGFKCMATCSNKVGYECIAIGSSCRALYLQGYTADGVYLLQGASGSTFNAYCHMTDGGWTLIARFSNADTKNWMQSSGSFWYDQGEFGSTTSPSTNADMINRAFFEIAGNDIKLSRSDVSAHSFLLYAGGCFSSVTFRGTITSYGNFRNNVRWLPTNDGCKGSCTIHSYGSVSGVGGFSQYSCSGDLKPSNTLGFWCHYSSGDGAVIMIGGGGSACGRADHGVGVTEANDPIFGSLSETHDFGNDGGGSQTTAYALNLWIR
eukprot:gene11505-21722_t